MTAMTATPAQIAAVVVDDAARDAASRDLDVVTAISKLRRDLDAVETAIRGGLRIPASVSGDSFAASTARDLAREIDRRNAAYERLVELQNIVRLLTHPTEES